jgi:hypothetical protein
MRWCLSEENDQIVHSCPPQVPWSRVGIRPAALRRQ